MPPPAARKQSWEPPVYAYSHYVPVTSHSKPLLYYRARKDEGRTAHYHRLGACQSSYNPPSPPRNSLLQPARWRTTGSPRGPRRPRPFRLQSTPLPSLLLAPSSTAISTYLPKKLVIKTLAIKTLDSLELRYLLRPPALQLQSHLMER